MSTTPKSPGQVNYEAHLAEFYRARVEIDQEPMPHKPWQHLWPWEQAAWKAAAGAVLDLRDDDAPSSGSLMSIPERIIVVCKDGTSKVHVLSEKHPVTRLQVTWFEQPPGRRCTIDFNDDECWQQMPPPKYTQMHCRSCGVSRKDRRAADLCQFGPGGAEAAHQWMYTE